MDETERERFEDLYGRPPVYPGDDGFVIKGKYLKDAHYHAHWPYLFESQSGMSFNPFNVSAILRSAGKWFVILLLLGTAYAIVEATINFLLALTVMELLALGVVVGLLIIVTVILWVALTNEDS